MADEAVQQRPMTLSSMAIASISCAAGAVLFGFIGAVGDSGAMFGLTGILFVAAIITGIIALAQRRPNATPQERSTDQVVAATGITIGTVGIVVMIVVILIAILFVMLMLWLFTCLISFGSAC